MVKQRKRQMKNKSRGAYDNPPAPRADLLRYTGPIPLRTAEAGIVATLRTLSVLATGAGVSFNTLIDNNPSGCDNWSEYSTAWTEYRVLGMRAQYIPVYDVNTTAITSGPIICNVLHTQVAPAITTLTNAFSFGDPQVKHTTKTFVREWRMTDPIEAQFEPTSSPTRTGYAFNYFSSGLTTANTYGYVYLTYLIQFRTASS